MTDQEVAAIIDEFRVPLHVRKHCETVSRFAVEIGQKIAAQGETVDLELLRHAGLLHDFVRVVDFRSFHPETFPYPATTDDVKFWENLREKYKGRGHEEVAAEILRARGFTFVAAIIEKHRFLQIEKGFEQLEEKILYYADKRTMHDAVVSLAERLADGEKRNGPAS